MDAHRRHVEEGRVADFDSLELIQVFVRGGEKANGKCREARKRRNRMTVHFHRRLVRPFQFSTRPAKDTLCGKRYGSRPDTEKEAKSENEFRPMESEEST